MKVMLISVNREDINMKTWPLGLACVAESVKSSGHIVEILDLMGDEDPRLRVEKALEEYQPQVIGISVRNIDTQKMSEPTFFLEGARDIVNACRRKSNSPIVLGGAGYSIYPMSLMEYLGADMGIQGEGETAFLELIDRIKRGSDLNGSPGLYLPRLGLVGPRTFARNLDALPLPDVESFENLIPRAKDFWLPVQTRRGCPMNCSYCSTGAIEGLTLRKRSPAKIVNWIGDWRKRGVERFYFVDNTFNLPPSYAKELVSEMLRANLGLSWRCIIYPTRIDPKLVSLMAEAGCKEVSVGFESGSTYILNGMNKKFSLDDVRHTCDSLAEFGIKRMGFLMLGGPGETMESSIESLQFADSLNLDMIKVTVGIRVYPGTTLAQAAIRDKIIEPTDNLLKPTFYLVPSLNGPLQNTVKEWMAKRPNWIS
jgi:radical SAM superfamily enzyme YgiQ (UPF0313 family)